MDLGLKGRTAFVAGGGRGLARGVATALAGEGARVAIVSRNSDALAQAAEEISKVTGAQVIAISADLSDEANIRRAVTAVVDEFGAIDILLNNTGGPPASGAALIPRETWTRQFEAMVLSVITLTDLVLPAMRSSGWGRILTIASSGVVEPNPLIALSNSLRSTLVGWSKTLAGEVASDGVTVNVLLPGWIATERMLEIDEAASLKSDQSVEEARARNIDRIPLGRYGTIEEFGAVAAFLSSQQASYITGSMLRIDGGAVRSV